MAADGDRGTRDVARPAEAQTAIVVLCAAVDEHLARWRTHEQPGQLPAHITLLTPFRALEDVTEEDRAQLRALFASEAPDIVRFTRFGRFPDVLYLAPEDAQRFRRLTHELTTRFPELQPYDGEFVDVIPHLTICRSSTSAALDAAQRELAEHLPIECRPREACLMTFDGVEWATQARFPFRSVE